MAVTKTKTRETTRKVTSGGGKKVCSILHRPSCHRKENKTPAERAGSREKPCARSSSNLERRNAHLAEDRGGERRGSSQKGRVDDV